MASKELKGVNVKDTLVRETNEQMLVKPVYTNEDWQAPKDPEIPGKNIKFTYQGFIHLREDPMQLCTLIDLGQ